MSIDELRRRTTRIFQCFLDSALEKQFVVLENAGAEDEYVQCKLSHRILYGEFGSREWASPDERRRLGAGARESLAGLGFTRGSPERNYGCDNLAQSAPYLADLSLRLHVAGYGALPTDVTVRSNVRAVGMLVGEDASKPKPSPYQWNARRHRYLRTTPVTAASPGLKFRVERALRSNVAEIGSTTEDFEALRRDVEQAGTWESLPA